MTFPRSIITQLPTSLWNSPIYEAYDYYVDNGLDALQGDLEEMFHLTNIATLSNYILGIKFKLSTCSCLTPKRSLDDLMSYERLIQACSYTEDPVRSLLWLLRITHNVDVCKGNFKVTGLQLKTSIENTGAIIAPLSSTSSSWPRAFTR